MLRMISITFTKFIKYLFGISIISFLDIIVSLSISTPQSGLKALLLDCDGVIWSVLFNPSWEVEVTFYLLLIGWDQSR